VQVHFRAEIAGLRAIAVASVLLFHLKIGGFEGGFVGVEVFFVISGYLITRNILRDLRAGRFSFDDFYVRRTKTKLSSSDVHGGLVSIRVKKCRRGPSVLLCANGHPPRHRFLR
jgi:hypothetical protein